MSSQGHSAQDTSSSAASPSTAPDLDMDIDDKIPKTDPGKWNVSFKASVFLQIIAIVGK